MAVRNYQDLVAWQKAMDLVEETYRVTRTFPPQAADRILGFAAEVGRLLNGLLRSLARYS